MRVLLCLVAVSCVASVAADVASSSSPSSSSPIGEIAGLKFDRFFMMMFENHGYAQCMQNAFWKQLSAQGLALENFTAISHPSQPNYVSQIGGDTLGCVNDNNIDINATNLVDLLEAKGISWKTYQEAYTPKAGGDCETKASLGTYHRKHNPFMSFIDISKNKARCQKIVNSAQLDADIAANQLPQFTYYTPDINNDAHDTNLDYAGKYLKAWLDKYMNIPNFTRNTLVLITFDEDEYLEGNHVYAVMLGQYVTPGTTDGGAYTHYSIAKSMEINWGLDNLGRHDATAKDFLGAIKDARPITDADIAARERVIREEMQHPLHPAQVRAF